MVFANEHGLSYLDFVADLLGIEMSRVRAKVRTQNKDVPHKHNVAVEQRDHHVAAVTSVQLVSYLIQAAFFT